MRMHATLSQDQLRRPRSLSDMTDMTPPFMIWQKSLLPRIYFGLTSSPESRPRPRRKAVKSRPNAKTHGERLERAGSVVLVTQVAGERRRRRRRLQVAEGGETEEDD